MIKIKKTENIISLVIIFLGILVFALSSIAFNQYKKINTSFLESITILGNEFKLEPGMFVYDFTIDNPEIKKISNGCEMPFTYKVSKMFEKKDNGFSGISYFVDGESHADFRIAFTEKDSEKIIAYYYFYITFTSPLKKAEGC